MDDGYIGTHGTGLHDSQQTLSLGCSEDGGRRGIPSGFNRSLEGEQEFRQLAWELLAQPCQIVDSRGATTFHLEVTSYKSSFAQISGWTQSALSDIRQNGTPAPRRRRWVRFYFGLLLVLGSLMSPPETRYAISAAYLIGVKGVTETKKREAEYVSRENLDGVGCIFQKYEFVAKRSSNDGFPSFAEMFKNHQIRQWAKSSRRLCGVQFEFIS